MTHNRKTAAIAQSILSGHDALYIRRAREVMPVLVRLARVERTITYGNLAKFFAIPNARNLNYVLGSIGATLDELSAEFSSRIPPLQSIVVNAGTGFPGLGFDKFLQDWYGIPRVTNDLRPVLLDGLHKEVFSYPKWDKVLERVGLEGATKIPKIASNIGRPKHVSGKGGGESADHKAFKLFLSMHPQLFDLPNNTNPGQIEHSLPSGDSVDVFFTTPRRHLAVEAKSLRSAEDEMIRGVFQCIKYEAVMQAESVWHSRHVICSSVLAIEGNATETVLRIAALLNVTILDNIRSGN